MLLQDWISIGDKLNEKYLHRYSLVVKPVHFDFHKLSIDSHGSAIRNYVVTFLSDRLLSVGNRLLEISRI